MIRILIFLVLLCNSVIASESKYSRSPRQGGVYVIAHRGAHDGIPENTLPAYAKAIDLGADFVEIDLRTTRDGELVSIHNRSMDAYVTGGDQAYVRELTLQELRSYDVGVRLGPQWKGLQVPTFDEILALCKDKIGIYLDLKDGSLEQAARLVEHYGMQQQVVWCIAPHEVETLRSACPTCIPMPDPESEETLPRLLKEYKPSVVAPVWNDFSATFATKCHEEQAMVFVDERESTQANWQQALDWGADGIQTDAPARLIAFLRGRDSHLSQRSEKNSVGPLGLAKLQVGTARVDITPPPEMKATLGGYGERMSRPAEGVHDRVYVKALVLDAKEDKRRFAIITADILGFPPAFKAALVKRIQEDGWTSDQILLLPSHSHTSIDMSAINPANVLGNKQMGLFDQPLYEWTLNRCETVLENASQDLVPGLLGTASIELEGRNRNRRNRNGTTDKSLTVTRVDQMDGQPIAVLVNFTAHPTFMSAEQMLFSGGWPGHMQNALQRLIGDGVNVLYYNGAEGDQAPVGQPGSGNDRWKAAEQYGREISNSAYQLWKEIKGEHEIVFGYHQHTITLPEKRAHRDFMKTGGKEYALSEALLQRILPVLFPSQTTSISLRLGDLLLVGVPGEMAAELGLEIKKKVASHSDAKLVAIGGLADAWISYILPPAEYDRGGYEASVSFYGRELGPRIVAGVLSGVENLHKHWKPAL